MVYKTRHRTLSRLAGHLPRFGRTLRWGFRIFLVLFIADLFYLAVTWPNWKEIAIGQIPQSKFISDYQQQRKKNKNLPALRWYPVHFESIPKHLVRAVIVAEDIRFYDHSGFDLIAFKEAMDYNLAEGRLILGASTISQQTVKNLLLSPARNPLRKWHELVLTWGMEQNLSKQRILEIYLNIAEFGRGVYGVQAASRTYWGVPASELSLLQAAELAATLPSPIKHNPRTRTPLFAKRSHKILRLLARFDGLVPDVIIENKPAVTAVPEENNRVKPALGGIGRDTF